MSFGVVCLLIASGHCFADTLMARSSVATAGRGVARGPRARVAGVDLSVAIEVFNLAGLARVPDDQSQRQAFATLMPQMGVVE